MKNHEFCYSFDSKNKIATAIKLQPDHVNGGFMPKPDNTLYEDPSSIELGDNETLVIESNALVKKSWYIGTKLYHKTDKTEIEITEVGKSPSDYPEYTTAEIPEPQYAYYYDFIDSAWVFNLAKYKSDACSRVTMLCVNENYTMFPQYKRDNIYSGSPASDNYPDYLKGDAGKLSIAKLNAVYQQIATSAQAAIQSSTIQSRDEVDAIITALNFPTEAEILMQIQS